MSPPNLPLGHKAYFELIILSNKENSRSYPFERETYICKGKYSLVRVSHSP